jgi:hypothetical protein
MGIHGKRLKSIGVGFPTIAVFSSVHQRLRDGIIHHKNQGTFRTQPRRDAARGPTQSGSECSPNCQSNAHISNAGIANSTSGRSVGLPMPLPTFCPTRGLLSSRTFLSLDCGISSACKTHFVLCRCRIDTKKDNQLPHHPMYGPPAIHTIPLQADSYIALGVVRSYRRPSN